uniref:Uncharacterized protein n=1 Tax=Glossina pallidipes TaxID=7398 RepID=A0A1B0A786_GLOPL
MLSSGVPVIKVSDYSSTASENNNSEGSSIVDGLQSASKRKSVVSSNDQMNGKHAQTPTLSLAANDGEDFKTLCSLKLSVYWQTELNRLFELYSCQQNMGLLYNSNGLMFADNVKVFRPFSVISYSLLLQDDLFELSNWCKYNAMTLSRDELYITFFYCFHKASLLFLIIILLSIHGLLAMILYVCVISSPNIDDAKAAIYAKILSSVVGEDYGAFNDLQQVV